MFILGKLTQLIKKNYRKETDVKVRWKNDSFIWTLFVGPCFCGRIYLLTYVTLTREFNIPDKKPKIKAETINFYPSYKTGTDLSTTDELKGSVKIFDNMLQNKPEDFSPSLTRSIHESSGVDFLSTVF